VPVKKLNIYTNKVLNGQGKIGERIFYGNSPGSGMVAKQPAN